MEEMSKEDIIKEIKEAWKETKEEFGDKFPFEDILEIKITKLKNE